MPDPYMQGSESITQAEHISPVKTGDNIAAKKVVLYEWDGSNWVRKPYGGSPALKLLLDDTSTTNVTYVGKAPIGTATSAAAWQIQKIDETSGMSITWANDGLFTAKWTEILTETYS